MKKYLYDGKLYEEPDAQFRLLKMLIERMVEESANNPSPDLLLLRKYADDTGRLLRLLQEEVIKVREEGGGVQYELLSDYRR